MPRLKHSSIGHRRRMDVYKEMVRIWKKKNPWCVVCPVVFPTRFRKRTREPHHSRGKLGDLLFMQEYWIPICRRCHNWVGDNIGKARELGFICRYGLWNRLPDDKEDR